jgi:L-iditol 2-dehydrogenase
MKACVTTGERRKLEYREVPTPSPGPGMLLMKTIYAFLCGSDLEYLDRPDIPPGEGRGHEFVAEVAEVGEGVTEFAVGDRVAPLPYGPESGNYKCIAEYFLIPPIGLQKVPDHVTNEEAIFVEPLCTGYGSVEASDVKPGQSAVIIGTGKIGLLGVMSARLLGAAPVIAVDIVQSRLDKALELGAHAALNAKEVDVVSEVQKLTDGGANVVIICASRGDVLNQAMEMCRNGSRIVIAGVTPTTTIEPRILVTKWLSVSGVLGGRWPETRNLMALALYLIAHKQVDARPMISEVMSLKDIQRALDTSYSGENTAVLLKP